MSSGKIEERSTDKWKFYRDEANKWRWRYIMQGRTVAQAYGSFARYGDCVQDARLHGYRDSAR
ncbi:MAG: DUF1508 domain-containing protein [Betaproteobacteria bacterium]|nr:DUF1508 domain-containing protein [Betaproteobacteria bacterium]